MYITTTNRDIRFDFRENGTRVEKWPLSNGSQNKNVYKIEGKVDVSPWFVCPIKCQVSECGSTKGRIS